MATGNRKKTLLLAGWIALVLLAISSSVSLAVVTSSYLFNLSNFSGTVRYNAVRPFIDAQTGEIYVAEGNTVKVFSQTGMEIYRFGDTPELGNIYDVATAPDGNIFLLSYRGYDGYSIHKCDFRGEPIGKIQVTNLPPQFAGFSPNRLILRQGRMVLASTAAMRAITTDLDGRYIKGYDLAALIGIEEKEIAATGMVGFSLDGEGSMLFTVPVHFRAYKVTSDGKVSSFGQRGSGPGRFGVVSGIAADDRGNYFVADTLRCVVMIFDKDFRFQGEFGYRGVKPGNLIGPKEVMVDANNRVFVTQLRSRGISVYSLSGN